MRSVAALAGALMLIMGAEALSDDRTFGGYECLDDCSGHKAGYEWAERRGIKRERDCIGNSNSFEEGCRAYVEDPFRGADEDDDGDEIE